MACPFAAFAALSAGVSSKFSASKHVAAHAHLINSSSSSSSSSTLSARLRTGTSRAHTAIERSAGVRALMGLARGVQLDSTLTRADYVSWLVALACVYAVLEAHLHHATPLLATLQEDATLLPSLLRTATLEADVRTHVQLLTGLDSSSATLADEEEALESLAHTDAQQHAPAHAHLINLLSASGATFPTPAHVRLLSKRFATNVLAYAGRLASIGVADGKLQASHRFDEGVCLTTPAGSETSSINGDAAQASPNTTGLLLAHAYIRYMGDLSGGQHIAKRVKIIWPVPAEQDGRQLGYDFYNFTPQVNSDMPEQDLKLTTRFRTAMDLALARLPAEQREAATVALVDEASLAFDLNRGLFNALVDAETEEEETQLNEPKHSVPSPLQIKSPFSLASSMGHLLALALVLALVAVGMQLHAYRSSQLLSSI